MRVNYRRHQHFRPRYPGGGLFVAKYVPRAPTPLREPRSSARPGLRRQVAVSALALILAFVATYMGVHFHLLG